jgi:hypothetical protein
MGGACGTYGRQVRCIQGSGRPEGKRPLGRPRRRWDYDIKKGSSRIGMRARTGLTWLRIGAGDGPCECGYEPSCFIK